MAAVDDDQRAAQINFGYLLKELFQNRMENFNCLGVNAKPDNARIIFWRAVAHVAEIAIEGNHNPFCALREFCDGLIVRCLQALFARVRRI